MALLTKPTPGKITLSVVLVLAVVLATKSAIDKKWEDPRDKEGG